MKKRRAATVALFNNKNELGVIRLIHLRKRFDFFSFLCYNIYEKRKGVGVYG